MSQPVMNYISTGLKESKTALKESQIGIIKLILFSFSSLFAKLFFMTYPLFTLAEFRIADQIKEMQKISFNEAFEDSGKLKKYLSTMNYALLNMTVMVVGIVFIAGLSFGLIQLGNSLDEFLRLRRTYLSLLFQLFSVALLIIFILAKSLYFSAVPFLIQSNGISLHDALSQTSLIMSKEGKLKLIHIHMAYLGIIASYIAIAALISYVLYLFAATPFFIITVIIFSFIFLILLSKILFSHTISKTTLFLDLIEASVYVDIKNNYLFKGLTNRVLKEDVLLKLFDQTPGTKSTTNETTEVKGD